MYVYSQDIPVGTADFTLVTPSTKFHFTWCGARGLVIKGLDPRSREGAWGPILTVLVMCKRLGQSHRYQVEQKLILSEWLQLAKMRCAQSPQGDETAKA